MSIKELDRLGIIEQVKAKKMTKTAAAKLLGLSRPHFHEVYKRFCRHGPAGLVSKRRGAPSNNRIPDSVKQAVIGIIREHYYDFNPCFAHEKLVEEHGFCISDETVRQIMMQEGLWHGKRRKAIRVHQMRERRPRLGELIQIDGSPHDWFEGRRDSCCLLVFIDDATSRLVGLRFVETECLEGYFDLMKDYLIKEGRPLALYSDRHTLFRVPDKEAYQGTGETQFGRAMRELGIELICANSPQAKGRVERANGTLQRRLTKELRMRKINDITTANAYLPEFMAKHNKRFAVDPRNPTNAHRATLPSRKQLNLILSVQEQRKLSHNLELSYKNIIYQIQGKTPSYSMRGAQVMVCESHGEVILLYKGKTLPFKTFDKHNRPTQVIASKELNVQFDKRILRNNKPKSTHPWRSPFLQSQAAVKIEHLPTAPPKQPDSSLSSASEIYG